MRDFHQLQNQMNDMQQQLIAIYSQIAPMSITADVTSAQINTDENGRAVLPQRIETTITVRQGTQPRNFSIGEIIIPNGWEYEVVGSKITFFIKQDAVIKPGRFKIPVYYNPVVSNDQYEDEEGNEYQDENELNYIEQTVSQTPFEHDLWFTYTCQSEGAFLGTITAVEDIPELLALNDYFVWGGEQTASNLSINGQFMPGRLYKYIGLDKAWKWEEDTDIGHNNIAMGDILNVADADLQNNNSNAYEYLQHLTANSIFTERLVANQAFIDKLSANEAFINKLFAEQITIADPGSIQSENYIEGSTGFKIDSNGIINAYEGRFAGGLGTIERVSMDYRGYLPFESGILVITACKVNTYVPTSGLPTTWISKKIVSCILLHSWIYTQYVSMSMNRLYYQDIVALYQGYITTQYVEEEEQGIIGKIYHNGYKIQSISSSITNNYDYLTFQLLKF